MNSNLRLLAITASLVFSACAAPASVEGVFAGDGFRLDCETPLAKQNASKRDIVVVLSDHDDVTLRTVNVELPNVGALPLGQPLEVGTGAGDQPSVDVIVGDLVVETRSDGVEVLSSVNPVRAVSVGGSVTIESRADGVITGSFRVDLDDGGFLEGGFAAEEI